MPSFTNQVANMVTIGPIVEVAVAPSFIFAQSMAKKGKTLPAPVRAVAMIDTGAAGTVVTPSLVKQLGLNPVGITKLSTPTTTEPVEVLQYNISLSFPNNVGVSSIIVIEAPLGGQHIQCLIGRDVLRNAVLTYIGYMNQFTLSF
jgi:predicted aspartyl protease